MEKSEGIDGEKWMSEDKDASDFQAIWKEIRLDMEETFHKLYADQLKKIIDDKFNEIHAKNDYLIRVLNKQIDDYYETYWRTKKNDPEFAGGEKIYVKMGVYRDKYSLDFEGFLEYLNDTLRHIKNEEA